MSIESFIPNSTIFIMLGLFLLVVVVLNQLVLKPTLEIIQERKKRTFESQDQAEDLLGKTKVLQEEYQQKFSQARAQAVEAREAILSKSRTEEQAIVSKARAENDETIAEMRSQVNVEKKEALLQLKQLAQGLADDMVEKVLSNSNDKEAA